MKGQGKELLARANKTLTDEDFIKLATAPDRIRITPELEWIKEVTVADFCKEREDRRKLISRNLFGKNFLRAESTGSQGC